MYGYCMVLMIRLCCHRFPLCKYTAFVHTHNKCVQQRNSLDRGHEAGCVQEKLCQSFVFRNKTTIENCCLILCNILSLVSKKEICHFPHLNLFQKTGIVCLGVRGYKWYP